tara:strand:+ start:235 stop:375 length:141 start_codon:yes stop_codon:yes gene_type:complete
MIIISDPGDEQESVWEGNIIEEIGRLYNVYNEVVIQIRNEISKHHE